MIDKKKLRAKKSGSIPTLKEHALLQTISHAQHQYIADIGSHELFTGLLNSILDITDSGYGFIGEILHDANGPYLKMRAITNIAWNKSTQDFYEKHMPTGMEFHNLDTLFGHVIKTGEPVVSSDPATDPRRGGLPPGHPALDRFLGLPLYSGKTLIGMIGIANYPAGEDGDELVAFLQPFITTCETLIEAFKREQARKQAEQELDETRQKLEACVDKKTTALKETRAKHNFLFETMAQGVVFYNAHGDLVEANPAAESIFGLSRNEMTGRGATDPRWRAIHSDGTAFGTGNHPVMVSLNTGVTLHDIVMGIFNPREERHRWIVLNVTPRFSDGKARPFQVCTTFSDITERSTAEKEREKLSRALEQTADTVMITDADGVIEYVNPAFSAVTGFDRDEILGKKPAVLKSGKHQPNYYDRLWRTILGGEPFRDVFINRRKDGALYYEEKTITPLKDANGTISHFISTGKDITESLQTEERLQYLIYHDVLTDLPNRLLFQELIGHALKKRNGSDHRLAVLSLDIDRFKNINDTLGHPIGDTLLKVVSERLTECLRIGDTVARLGDDEFAVLIEDVQSVDEVSTVIRQIRKALETPFTIGGQELVVTASIGVSLFPDDGDDAKTLLKNADIAMFRAKAQGRNSHQFYSDEMSSRSFSHLMLETRLYRALENKEFVLHYQPQIDVSTWKIIGVEALIRWQHPERGLVGPQEFIPLLEDTGLIAAVGDWVLYEACRQAMTWRELYSVPLRMSVNVSSRQFSLADFAARVSSALRTAALPSDALELEITESLLMRDDKAILANLDALKAIGIKVAIDDFGTGHSSLNYLKRFSVQTIKIDRSFVRDLASNAEDAAIVAAIIALANSLKLHIVAEGVETREQLGILQAGSCNHMQGFLLSRPVPAQEMIELLKKTGPYWESRASLVS